MRSAEIDDLVDAFVLKVNSRQHERLPVKDVPQFLRRPSSGDDPDQWTDWQIHAGDNSGVIEDLERRIGRRFPASYRSLVARDCSPAFDCGPLFFFANTGEDIWDELSIRLFSASDMSPALLNAGYVQIGRPHQYNYDPVCLGPQVALKEPAVVPTRP